MAKRTLQLLYPKQVDDSREVTLKMLNQIVKNCNGNSRFPVARGHNRAMGFWGDHEAADGKMNNLRLDDDTLLGDVEFQPEMEKDYKADKFPGWSVGIFKTEKEGWQMDHLAMLGSVGAAFKDLQDVTGGNFSLVDSADDFATVECFSADNDKKTLWLLQSTPKPVRVETPAPVAASDKGDDEMSKELQEKFAAQSEAFEASRKENAELKAGMMKLEAESKARQEFETKRRVQEFSVVKDSMLKAAKDRGVTETAREVLSKALDGHDELYASGVISRGLFDAITDVFSELKPKVAPGEIHEDDPDPEPVKSIDKYSDEEAVNCFNN